MKPFQIRTVPSVLAGLIFLASRIGTAQTTESGSPTPSAAINFPVTEADVAFMTGMIEHHAQAVLISGWAVSHGASQSIKLLTERIVVGQTDEIELMSRWLQDQNKPVPEADTAYTRSMGSMPGMDSTTMMPGMLSADQLAQLDRARGTEFDRLFLTFMIQHHLGAITMVDKLFGTQGAAQDESTFRLASNIYADQTTEIARMQLMLDALPSGEYRQ